MHQPPGGRLRSRIHAAGSPGEGQPLAPGGVHAAGGGEEDAIFDALGVPVFVVDAEARLTRANGPARRALGLGPPGAAPPPPLPPLLAALRLRRPQGAAGAWPELPVARALRGEPVHGELLELTDASGRARAVAATATPLRSGEQVTGAVVVWYDVTAQLAAQEAARRAERDLRRSEALYRGIAASIPGGVVCVVDRELRYIVAEGQVLGELGFDRERMEGRTVEEVVPGPPGAHAAALFRRALAGEALTRESRYAGRSLLTHYGPLRGPAGVEAALALAVDITSRKQAEDALRASEARFRALEAERKQEAEREAALRRAAEEAGRAKDEFLAMLGHELRNPLAPILTAAQLLRMRAGTAFAREQAIIERQARHMTRLIDDLLDVARITRGAVELERRPVELAAVLARAVEMASPLLEARAQRLELAAPPGLEVMGDEERLAQVFANLLSNAAKYGAPGGRIDVAATAADGWARIAFKDDGVGIAAELLPRIFDLFVQGDRHLDRAQGGLGLGLALVRTLTAAHGGRVEARSDGPGRGAEFVVSLPLRPAGAAPAGAPEPAPPSRPRPPGRRVLVVDDNRDAAELLAEGLRLQGHLVRVAFDGPAALEAAAELNPDVALVDIGLPVMSGYEVARRLRDGGARCRLVAVTGYGQAADRVRAWEHGFDDHLVKPVDLEAVRELVRSAPRGG